MHLDNQLSENRRLGLTFHRTIPFVRSAISDVIKDLRAYKGEEIQLTRQELKSKSDLGSIYVEAMPRYAFGAGLLTDQKKISAFGETALSSDPLLDQTLTQWLMHYHLSSPSGPGPIFWHELVRTRFRSGDVLSAQEVSEQIGQIFLKTEGKPLAPRSARTTATIFLGTYTNTEGLGNLGILEKQSDDYYRVLDPDPPSTWVITYALLHWWVNQFENQVTINLNELYGERGLTSLFMISRGRMNTCLEEMQDDGVIELYRIAPPYQIVLLRRDEEYILRKIYGV